MKWCVNGVPPHIINITQHFYTTGNRIVTTATIYNNMYTYLQTTATTVCLLATWTVWALFILFLTFNTSSLITDNDTEKFNYFGIFIEKIIFEKTLSTQHTVIILKELFVLLCLMLSLLLPVLGSWDRTHTHAAEFTHMRWNTLTVDTHTCVHTHSSAWLGGTFANTKL